MDDKGVVNCHQHIRMMGHLGYQDGSISQSCPSQDCIPVYKWLRFVTCITKPSSLSSQACVLILSCGFILWATPLPLIICRTFSKNTQSTIKWKSVVSHIQFANRQNEQRRTTTRYCLGTFSV